MVLLPTQSLQISIFFGLILLLISLFAPTSSNGQVTNLGWVCPHDKQEYALNSTYHSNLLAAFSNLTSLSSSTVFADTVAGSGTGDQVYAVYHCRYDFSLETCHECVENATAKVPLVCSSKQALITYKECVLGYANRPIVSAVDLDLSYKVCAIPVPDDDGAINRTVGPVLEELMAEATSENSTRYFAVGRGNYSVYQEIYSLVQCAPVLSKTQCKECLYDAYNYTVGGCASSGMLVGFQSGPSCQIRYGIFRFFNLSSGPGSGPGFGPVPISNSSTPQVDSSGSHFRSIISKRERFIFFLFLFCILLAT